MSRLRESFADVHDQVQKLRPPSQMAFVSKYQDIAPHTGQSSVRQGKLGVSDWVQVPIE
jgi:hypothetical protein